jgi:hypothetical protein
LRFLQLAREHRDSDLSAQAARFGRTPEYIECHPDDLALRLFEHQLKIDSTVPETEMVDSLRVSVSQVVERRRVTSSDNCSDDELSSLMHLILDIAGEIAVGVVLITRGGPPEPSSNWLAAYHPPNLLGNRMIWLGLDCELRYVSLVPTTQLIVKSIDLSSISESSVRNSAAKIRREMGFQSFQLLSSLVQKRMNIPSRDPGSPWSGYLGKSPTVGGALNFYRLLSAIWLVKQAGSNNLTGLGLSFRLFSKSVEAMEPEQRSKVREFDIDCKLSLF